MRVIGKILRRAFPLAMLLLGASILAALLGFGGAYLFGYLAAGLGIAGGVAATLLPNVTTEEEESGWLALLIEGFSGDGSDSGDSGGDGGGGDGGGGDGGGGDGGGGD
jgi:uncharacterized membrane protein YgcG